MAMIKCPECGEEVSDRSTMCIHCGSPLQAENTSQTAMAGETNRKRKPKHVLIWVCLFLGLWTAFCFSQVSSSKSNSSDKANEEFIAHVISCAQTEVGKALKSPSTAIWGTAEALFNDGYGRHVVYVSVEAQNGFGGYSKHDFLVVVLNVSNENGEWGYEVYTNRSLLDVTSYPSTVSKFKNGEATPIVSSFLELNHWGEEHA